MKIGFIKYYTIARYLESIKSHLIYSRFEIIEGSKDFRLFEVEKDLNFTQSFEIFHVLELFLPSSASTQLNSTSIKAEVSFISTLIQPPTQPPGTEDITHD